MIQPHERAGTPLDLEQALERPGRVFSSPDEVVIDARLTRQQKVDVLRRWAAQREGETADLPRVMRALDRVTGGRGFAGRRASGSA